MAQLPRGYEQRQSGLIWPENVPKPDTPSMVRALLALSRGMDLDVANLKAGSGLPTFIAAINTLGSYDALTAALELVAADISDLGTAATGDIGTDVQAHDADLAAFAALSGVQGDIIYRDASQWQRLAKGTADQILAVNSGATAPEWKSITRAYATIRGTSTQSTPNTTLTAIRWDAVDKDTAWQPNDGGGAQRFWLGPDQTFTAVDTGADNATVTGHGFTTGEGPFKLTTTGTLPTGLSTGTNYWAINDGTNSLGFATSRANALADTRVDITGSGSGTHTIDTERYWVIPAGVTLVTIYMQARFATNNTGFRVGAVNLEGSSTLDGNRQPRHQTGTAGNEDFVAATAFNVECSEGQRYETSVFQSSGGNLNVKDNTSFSFSTITVEEPLAW